MAENLDPFTPTILSLSTYEPKYELPEHEGLAEGANLAETTKVEQGETDDLRLSCLCHGMIENISFYQHAHRSDKV